MTWERGFLAKKLKICPVACNKCYSIWETCYTTMVILFKVHRWLLLSHLSLRMVKYSWKFTKVELELLFRIYKPTLWRLLTTAPSAGEERDCSCRQLHLGGGDGDLLDRSNSGLDRGLVHCSMSGEGGDLFDRSMSGGYIDLVDRPS